MSGRLKVIIIGGGFGAAQRFRCASMPVLAEYFFEVDTQSQLIKNCKPRSITFLLQGGNQMTTTRSRSGLFSGSNAATARSMVASLPFLWMARPNK